MLGLEEKVNWDDFPNTVPMDTSAEQDSGLQLPGENFPQEELAAMVVISRGYSSLVSYSMSLIKRWGIEAMDTEEVDTTSTPTRQKIEPRQQMVQGKKRQAKKKNVVKI